MQLQLDEKTNKLLENIQTNEILSNQYEDKIIHLQLQLNIYKNKENDLFQFTNDIIHFIKKINLKDNYIDYNDLSNDNLNNPIVRKDILQKIEIEIIKLKDKIKESEKNSNAGNIYILNICILNIYTYL